MRSVSSRSRPYKAYRIRRLLHSYSNLTCDTAIEMVRGRAPVIVATGSQNLIETRALTEHAVKAGADAELDARLARYSFDASCAQCMAGCDIFHKKRHGHDGHLWTFMDICGHFLAVFEAVRTARMRWTGQGSAFQFCIFTLSKCL